MLESILRLLGMIVLPHPELPPSMDPMSGHCRKSVTVQDLSFSGSTPPILPRRVSTPPKVARPMSLGAAPTIATYTAIGRRRHTLCICPDHCPPGTTPIGDTSQDFSFRDDTPPTGSHPLPVVMRKTLQARDPPSPSPQPHFHMFNEFSTRNDRPSMTPEKRIPEFNVSSPLAHRQGLRGTNQVVISTPTKSESKFLAHTRAGSPGDLPQAVRERRLNYRRPNEGSVQTRSRLFELSPILEDAHVLDAYFGPPVIEDQVDQWSDFDSESSDSSFGELLEVKTMGNVSVCSILNESQIDGDEGGVKSTHEPCIPALTFTSPTPETLRSVATSDPSEPSVDENQGRLAVLTLAERSMVLESVALVSSSVNTQPHLDSWTLPVVPAVGEDTQDGMKSGNTSPRQERPQLWSRIGSRLLHIFVPPGRVSAQAAGAKATARGRARCISSIDNARGMASSTAARGDLIDQLAVSVYSHGD